MDLNNTLEETNALLDDAVDATSRSLKYRD